MAPRPAPDLDARREQVVAAARRVAESEGWPAVTMRRVAGELGVTQPVLYSAFAGRQAVVDAVALAGFGELAEALESARPVPEARMRAYLAFAERHDWDQKVDEIIERTIRPFTKVAATVNGQDNSVADQALGLSPHSVQVHPKRAAGAL